MAADRHLLVGLLALQTGLIQQAHLVAAFHAWTCDKAQSLVDHLVALGHMSAAQRSAIEALAALHVEAHGGDASASLASVPVDESTRASLANVTDPDIEQTLGHVGSGHGSTEDGQIDAHRTGSYSVGSATSSGQRFRVLRPHARGGLGAVYVALDAELNREVALKQILDKHADDPVSRNRFLLEAEVTGGLEHPGIVPVYSLGTYPDGRPYYAMRFIRGDSLKEAIDRFHGNGPHPGPLSPREDGRRAGEGASHDLQLRRLLRRFTDVCNAIEYAHSRGVLHRDIKPANVVLGKHGETLVVDWGLAKATGRTEPGVDSGERTLVPSSTSGSADTLPGSALGTPAYMSPEQAEGNLEHLGPRSDVCSLGATLYCLLAGKPPFEGDALEVLRLVRRGEFPPVRQFNPGIDRALEAVCLKAMAHNPADRYASARALADDIERWMADESVSAWREPIWRRARRWGRRHRTLVVAGVMLLATATVALSVGTLLLGYANSRTEKQRAIAEKNFVLAEQSAAHAERQRQRAESNFALARDAVDEFSTQVSENTLLRSPLPGLQPLRNELLRTALHYNQAFVDRQGDEPGLRADLARARFRMGGITDALGSKTEALDHYEKARALWEELRELDPDASRYQWELARACRDIGALLSENLGRAAEARQPFERAQALLERLYRADPLRPEYRTDLALTYRFLSRYFDNQGDHRAEARRFGEQALKLWEEQARHDPGANRQVATQSTLLGFWHTRYGTAEEALRYFGRSRELLQSMITGPPQYPLSEELRRLEVNIGYLHDSRTGRLDEALRHYELAQNLAAQNARQNPSVIQLQLIWATTLVQPAGIRRNLHQIERGIEDSRQAIRVLETVLAIDPSNSRVHGELLEAHTTLAEFLTDAEIYPEAVRELDRARFFFDRVGSQTDYQMIKLRTYDTLAEVRRAQGHSAEAIQAARAAVDLIKRLNDEARLSPEDLQQLLRYYESLSELQLEQDQPEGSIDTLRAALKIVPDPIVRIELASSLLRSGRPAEAARELEQGGAALASGISVISERQLAKAKALALSHTIASSPKLSLSDSQRRAHDADADRAIVELQEAVKSGYGNLRKLQTEPAFAGIRSRPDFQMLMMDLSFPKEALTP
jgi:serine/threonine-protein kinase